MEEKEGQAENYILPTLNAQIFKQYDTSNYEQFSHSLMEERSAG